MTLLIITIVLMLLTVVGVVIGVTIKKSKYLNSYNMTEDHIKEAKKHFNKKFLLSLASIGWVFILLFGSFTKVGANTVGIIYDEMNGGIQDRTLDEGFQFKTIFQHVTTISTTNRTSKVETYGQTNDGQSALFELSIIYNIQKENAGKFYRKTNSSDISSEQLNSIVKKSLQSSTSQYNIFDLLSTGLETVRNDFEVDLREQLLDNYFISVISASFDDIDAGEDVEKILQAVATAEQKVKIATAEAEAALITANNEAQITKVLADAQAYATQAQGVAVGEAAAAYVVAVEDMINKLYCNVNSVDPSNITYDADTGYIKTFVPVDSSTGLEVMTYSQCADTVLGVIFYSTWDGKLPTVLTSDSLSALIGSLIGG